MLKGGKKGIVRKDLVKKVVGQVFKQENFKLGNELVGQFVYQIRRELVVNFGKTTVQAHMLVTRANLNDYLTKHLLALHDSPHEWAIKLLTKNNDVETLERYYSS